MGRRRQYETNNVKEVAKDRVKNNIYESRIGENGKNLAKLMSDAYYKGLSIEEIVNTVMNLEGFSENFNYIIKGHSKEEISERLREVMRARVL